MSRPTDDIQERMVILLQSGNDLSVAAQAIGLDPAEVEMWLADESNEEFRKAIHRARATAEATLVSRVQQAASNGSWQAAAWLLDRGFPNWRRPTAEQKNKDAAEPAPGGDPFAALDNVTELRPRRSS